jgi:hypothetical protein
MFFPATTSSQDLSPGSASDGRSRTWRHIISVDEAGKDGGAYRPKVLAALTQVRIH